MCFYIHHRQWDEFVLCRQNPLLYDQLFWVLCESPDGAVAVWCLLSVEGKPLLWYLDRTPTTTVRHLPDIAILSSDSWAPVSIVRRRHVCFALDPPSAALLDWPIIACPGMFARVGETRGFQVYSKFTRSKTILFVGFLLISLIEQSTWWTLHTARSPAPTYS